uniref:ATP synthase F0 subunit 8 n=1 Tax=Siphonodentalium lobatum TaxID=203167 RepID=Q6VEH7_9MOLL|nr:ATP synthase F0 subunit 8 [Siphonodentalium lobatum]AAP91671.1 ATP synthase F0 subunit 8 [Siphonodentalium lobatum]
MIPQLAPLNWLLSYLAIWMTISFVRDN